MKTKNRLKTYLIDSNNTLADDFEKIVDAADQPMSDTAIISNFYLSKFTSKYSKVCISAEGVDELFCGYDTYLADIIKKKLRDIIEFDQALIINLEPLDGREDFADRNDTMITVRLHRYLKLS